MQASLNVAVIKTTWLPMRPTVASAAVPITRIVIQPRGEGGGGRGHRNSQFVSTGNPVFVRAAPVIDPSSEIAHDERKAP
ncbi:hypothetical protein MRX96_043997 [Rhipicephalus microplus]